MERGSHVRNTTHPTKAKNKPRILCAATTNGGQRCRCWSQRDSIYCYNHRNYNPDEAIVAKSYQATIPSSLPNLTEQEVHANEKAIQKKIQRKKASDARKAAREEKRLIAAVTKESKAIAKEAGVEVAFSLRSLEDCLALIEFSVEEVIDQQPSLNKSRLLITAARTAGQLIIQSGVADKAVDWFMQNVKLVAGVDLDQI